jgi:hypothetical protein
MATQLPSTISTVPDLELLLDSLGVWQVAEVPYNVFDVIFPPGVHDPGAQLRAYDVGAAHGCAIWNDARTQKVIFTRRKSP